MKLRKRISARIDLSSRATVSIILSTEKHMKGWPMRGWRPPGSGWSRPKIAFVGKSRASGNSCDVAQHEQIVAAAAKSDAGAFRFFNVAELIASTRAVGFNCCAHVHDAVRRLAQRQSSRAGLRSLHGARLSRQQRAAMIKSAALCCRRAAHRRHDHADLPREIRERGEHV